MEMEMVVSGQRYVREKIIGIGSGSSSTTVYLMKSKETQIQDSKLPLLLIMKHIPISDSDSLHHEYKVFTQLYDCPSILQCYGEGTSMEKGIEFYSIWLEFPQGGSLSDRIKKSIAGHGFGLPEIDVIRYTRSILLGLQCIHRCGYVHCHLKPQNILICENDTAKIADFGLSMKTHQEKNKFKIKGTPLYMAPEAIFSESFKPISDVWGLGCIVLEMLSGNPPWKFAPKTNVMDALSFIACSKELPLFPEKASPLAIDFLRKCLVRDVRLRWTPDMLLTHPFLEDGSC